MCHYYYVCFQPKGLQANTEKKLFVEKVKNKEIRNTEETDTQGESFTFKFISTNLKQLTSRLEIKKKILIGKQDERLKYKPGNWVKSKLELQDLQKRLHLE